MHLLALNWLGLKAPVNHLPQLITRSYPSMSETPFSPAPTVCSCPARFLLFLSSLFSAVRLAQGLLNQANLERHLAG
jgi:hypothetical protein